MFLGAVHRPGHRTGLDILSDLGSARDLPLCMLLPWALPSSPAVAHHVRTQFLRVLCGSPTCSAEGAHGFQTRKTQSNKKSQHSSTPWTEKPLPGPPSRPDHTPAWSRPHQDQHLIFKRRTRAESQHHRRLCPGASVSSLGSAPPSLISSLSTCGCHAPALVSFFFFWSPF